MLQRLKRLTSNFRKHPRRWRYLSSRVLWVSGLSRLIVIHHQGGFKIRFYPSSVSSTAFENPEMGMKDIGFLRAALRPGDTYVDVGANIGHLALTAALRVGEGGRVVAIEPHPRIFGFLRGNVALNKVANIELHNLAIGEEPGELRFSDQLSDDMNRVTRDAGLTVPVKTLDDVIGDRSVDLLKIDAEGYEPWILRGAGGVLSRTRLLYIEVGRDNLANFDEVPETVLGQLRDAGFTLFCVQDRDLTPVDAEPITGTVNVVGVRPDDLDAFVQLTGYRIRR